MQRRSVIELLQRALPALAVLTSDPYSASAAAGRTIAQSVGVDQLDVGVLADPRALVDGDGLKPLIWGARERCDPTDVACSQGGVEGALEVQPLPNVAAEVTDRVRLSMQVGGESIGVIELGLWRELAPSSVDAFVKLAAGTYGYDPQEGEEPASLDSSVVLRVLRGKQVVLGGLKKQGGSIRLVAGKTRPQRVPIPPPTINDSPNGISNDVAGLISWRKGGGLFEWTLTPRANSELDGSQLVFGQVLAGMDVLERINVIATNNYNSGPMATVRVSRVQVL
eukprot:CAMPEP_0115865394 /NCGR_PEP_ID=MMETSP0287-20121206/19697_1 /TAXON_ID=412157 /ORGANISM="Chrysochromulina rotalis, Strain UIO044" /LENGTH=280 /DNA_ID=CAMNT_0003319901 /DNA_START=62 /DNA_END=904 /DNA_ORIENTATION=-